MLGRVAFAECGCAMLRWAALYPRLRLLDLLLLNFQAKLRLPPFKLGVCPVLLPLLLRYYCHWMQRRNTFVYTVYYCVLAVLPEFCKDAETPPGVARSRKLGYVAESSKQQGPVHVTPQFSFWR